MAAASRHERSRRWGFGWFGFALCLTVFLYAGVAGAVEVVDVRVGQHAKFTRLVFELDAPVGYRITRTQAASGEQLRLALQARAQPSKFSLKGGRVESVDVRAETDAAVIIIELRDAKARFSEMTLTNPYRVVIDVLAPAGVASATAARPKNLERKPAVAKTPASAQPAAVAPPMKSTKPARATVATAQAPPIAEPRVPVKPVAAKPALAARPRGAERQAATPAAALPLERMDDADRPSGPTWAWAALAGLILLVAGLLAARRRRRAFHGEAGVPAPVDASASPFEGLVPEVRSQVEPAAEVELEAQTQTQEAGPRMLEVEEEIAGDAGGEPVDEEEGFALAEAGPSAASIAPATERLHPILEQLEARLVSMEARLEDLEAGKSGFEKQVDTHTEELRVQRAAIARTQRALRQISRPSDAEVATHESVGSTRARVGRRDADGED